MTRRKKIAIICSTDYKTYPLGGMMSFILDSLPYLIDEFDITLWGVSVNGKLVSDIKVKDVTCKIRSFSNVKTTNKIIPNFFKVIYGIWKSRKDILNENYDILYIHGIPLSFPFFNKKAKVINHIHGMTNPFSMTANKLARNNLSIRMYEKYRNWIVRKSDLIFLASDKKGHKEFSNRFDRLDKKIIYVPNFADIDIFSNMDKKTARNSLQLNLDEVFLVNTGRVSLQKDPILLINTFAYLVNNLNFKAKLVVIGDGELMNSVRMLIKQHKIEKDVLLAGKLDRNTINLWLNASDLYVYTSHANGFPISLAESGICALPIVTTDVTGVHDLVVNGQTGFLIEERCPKTIALKIIEAYKNNSIFSENILNAANSFKPVVVLNNMIKEFNLLSVR